MARILIVEDDRRISALLSDLLRSVMITGMADEVAITTALTRGAFAYIPKPFNVEYVKHLIAVARARVGVS